MSSSSDEFSNYSSDTSNVKYNNYIKDTKKLSTKVIDFSPNMKVEHDNFYIQSNLEGYPKFFNSNTVKFVPYDNFPNIC